MPLTTPSTKVWLCKTMPWHRHRTPRCSSHVSFNPICFTQLNAFPYFVEHSRLPARSEGAHHCNDCAYAQRVARPRSANVCRVPFHTRLRTTKYHAVRHQSRRINKGVVSRACGLVRLLQLRGTQFMRWSSFWCTAGVSCLPRHLATRTRVVLRVATV